MLVRLLAAGVLNQDAPYRLSGGGEEMTAVVPVRLLPTTDQTQVGFVNQGGGVERLARLLLGQLLRRQLAQLVVDQRQQLPGCVRIALLDRVEHLRDRVHGLPPHKPWRFPGRRSASARPAAAVVRPGGRVEPRPRGGPLTAGAEGRPLRTRLVRRSRGTLLEKGQALRPGTVAYCSRGRCRERAVGGRGYRRRRSRPP